MDLNLSSNQQRVIGCLIEKAITTPDQYPLSLNALVNACNQKSSREPVMALTELEVQETVDELSKLRMVRSESGFGSRVEKYSHRFCNTEFSELQFSEQELGIVCVMLLRGPQTPGELRSRTNRLCSFSDIGQVESALDNLASREEGPMVLCLPKEPGKRESRYAHLFGEQKSIEDFDLPVASVQEVARGGQSEETELRLDALEAEVASLKEELQALKARLG